MARNVLASKRGWGYDPANSLLNAYVDGAAVVNLSATTTLGTASLGVSMTFTPITALSHAALEGIVTYTPSTAGSGGSVPIGVRAKVVLSASCTSTLYMWGLQAQLDFSAGSALNAPAGQSAAIRAVLTSSGSQSWTNGKLSGLYIDNLIGDDTSGLGARGSSMIRMANNGGGMSEIFDIWGSGVDYFAHFVGCKDVGGMIDDSLVGAETSSHRIKVMVGGDLRYIYLYD